MAGEVNDGGAAFPLYSRDEARDIPGMTLRDYFAGQALAGYRSSELHSGTASDRMAAWCYADADAMLKAREPAD